jgi:hypothetical protein
MAVTVKRPSGRTSGLNAERKNKLREALKSVGVDKDTISRLLSSRRLGRITVPLFARGTVNDEFNDLWLVRLPEFLRWFEKEFPDGLLRWDPEFEDPTTGKARPVLRVNFNYQEDDWGDHFSYRPTSLEEEAYHKKLRELRPKNGDKVDVGSIL